MSTSPASVRLTGRLLHTTVALISLSFILAAPRAAQAQPPPLQFFKNYFVTGDYVVRGVSLWRKGVNGQATALIPALGQFGGPDAVPPTADILAAFLYIQTAEKDQGSGIHHAKFTGHDLGPFNKEGSTELAGSGTFAKALVDWGTASPPCWNFSYPGGRRLMTYRVDVLRFLPIDPITKKQSLATALEIVVPDAGKLFADDDEGKTENYKSDLPRALGASLVVVYRDRTKPFSGIMLYDGAFRKRENLSMQQPIAGFYQASDVNPSVKMSHVVGDGRLSLSERVYLDGDLIATNPFRSSSGPKWDNVTWLWNSASPVPGRAAETIVKVDPDTSRSDCLTYSAIVLRTTVQDTDGDGLIDIWESSQAPLDDPNVPNDPQLPGGGYLPDLHEMADPNVPDIFAQVDYLYTADCVPPHCNSVVPTVPRTTYGGTAKPAHSHLPSLNALTMVGDAFWNAPTPIRVHFDVGNNYQGLGNPYIVPAQYARGGQGLSETKLCPDQTVPEPLPPVKECRDANGQQLEMPGQYPAYPGTVGWKTGFAYLKDALLGFDRNRKDIFRYILAGHFVGLPVEPCLKLVGGTEVSDFECQNGQNANPLFHVPRTNSGIADFPGAEVYLSLGGFDNENGFPVGTDDMVVGTIMHEWGHNFLFTHGGALPQPDPSTSLITREPNCQANNLSVMNYVFQWGLSDKNGITSFDYSREEIGAPDESALIEQSLYFGLGSSEPRYRTKWYAPWLTSYLKNLNAKAATKHCDGSPLTPEEQADLDAGGGMVRIEAPTVLGDVDWNANGSIGDGGQVDINFNGLLETQLEPSSNDWALIRLQEMGGRRNVGGYYLDTAGRNAVGPMSLDVGRGDIGRGDIGRGDIGRGDIGRGDIGRGDIGVAVGRGDIGRGDIGRGDIGRGDIGLPKEGRGDIGRGDIGRGDIGRGGGDLDVGGPDEPPGDMPVETAKAAEGDAEVGPPRALKACLTSELVPYDSVPCAKRPDDAADANLPVHLDWQPPNLGGAVVDEYAIYRLEYTGPFDDFHPPADLSEAIHVDTIDDEDTEYDDHDAPAGKQLAYFVRGRYYEPIPEAIDAMTCVEEGGVVVSGEGSACRFETAISNFDTVETPPASTEPVTVGVANAGRCYPFMCNNSGTSEGQSIHYQQVYAASEFSGLTQIDSLTFFRVFAAQFGGTSTILPGHYQVSLSTTTRAVNGLSTDLASNIGANNKVIFNSALGSVSTTPSFTINASTPFVYNPAAGNLLLDIVVTNQTVLPNGEGNGYNDADETGTVTSRAIAVVNGANVAEGIGLVTEFNKVVD